MFLVSANFGKVYLKGHAYVLSIGAAVFKIIVEVDAGLFSGRVPICDLVQDDDLILSCFCVMLCAFLDLQKGNILNLCVSAAPEICLLRN